MAKARDQHRRRKHRRRPERESSGSYDPWFVVLRRLFQELRPLWKLQFVVLFLTLGQAFFGFLPPLILGDIVNRLQKGQEINTLFYLGIVVGFAVGAGLLSYAVGYFTQRLSHQFLLVTREKMYGHMQSLPLAYFDKNQTGKLVSNVMNDPSTVQSLITGNLNTMASDAAQLILVLIILFSISPTLALLALVATPIYIYNIWRTMKPISQKSEELRRERDEMFGDMQEKLTGISVVKGFGKEQWEVRSFHSLTRGILGLNMDLSRLGSRMWTFADALGGIGQALVLYFGALMCLRGEMLPGTLVMFLLYSVGYVYGPIVRFLLVLDPLARTHAALNRIFRTLDAKNLVSDLPNAPEMPKVKGEVEYRDLWFEYIKDTPVLKGINLHVQPGELIAFVGFSGSGKTTLANLLLRHFDPTSGQVLVDGIDLRTVQVRSYRSQVGYVIQEPALFNTTILENIRYGRPEASPEEVKEAAKAANIHETIVALESGYDTRLGEKGISLSQGEKQRIAIARALLADPRILILDEATSSLDSQTEALVQDALDRLLRGRTSFVIAHRLSTIIKADRIVVLEEGVITHIGNHKDLLNEPEGLYSRMFRQQFAAALS
ncbi:MAG: ABC transporter ATP-binding protein/permease [Fimbriimonadaceae bacterium]|jgi:subfamily B ATP-binding cassette protein MsbA|nr:ABC transporter ATP-binding protein/permease [Fimbriimonadaceae bacterium]